MSNQTLQKSVINTSAWTVAGFAITQLLRLGSSIILAALLFEEAFALVAICLAISQGLHMFSDLGLGPSVIQNPRGDDRKFLDTVWSIQIIRGVILAAVCALLAYPVASFYGANDPYAWELQHLILIIAVATLVEGFDSTKIHLSSRYLNISRLIIVQIIAQAVSVVIMILIAIFTRSVYALVIGVLSSAIMTTVLSHLIIPGKNNRLHWNSDIAKEIIHFGKWIFLSTIITFFTLQIDKLVFSRLFPLGEVGVYVIAFNIAVMGEMLVSRLVHSVAFPSFSKILNQQGELTRAVTIAKQSCLGVGAYITAGLVGCGQFFIDSVYDDRYSNAGIFLPILAAGAWFVIVESIYSSALLARGRSNWLAITNAAKVIGFCALLWPAIHFGGFMGAVFAVAGSNVIRLLTCLVGASRIGLHSRRTDVLYTLFWTITAAIVYLAGVLLERYYNPPSIVIFLGQAALTTLIFGPLLFQSAVKLIKNEKNNSEV